MPVILILWKSAMSEICKLKIPQEIIYHVLVNNMGQRLQWKL